MMSKKEGTAVSDEEAIKNLLMLLLLKQGVDPAVVATATGIPEGTLRRKFPMRLIKKPRGAGDE